VTAEPASAKTILSLPRIVGASCAAALVAATINTLLPVTAVAAFETPAAFEPLAWSAVVIASVIGALGAGACFAILSRLVRRLVPVFLVVVGAGLVASMYPPIALAFADPLPYPGTEMGAVTTLMLMHVVVAVTSTAFLVRAVPTQPSAGGPR